VQKILVLLFGILVTNLAYAVNITFVLPDYKEHKFWEIVADNIRSMANDSPYSVDIIHIADNRFTQYEVISELLQSDSKPDYLVYRPFNNTGFQLFDLLEEHQVKFITLENVFTPEQAKLARKPGERFKYWLNQVEYDQSQGGALLAQSLIEQHRIEQAKLPIFITGISGTHETLSYNRNNGLLTFFAPEKQITINQIFYMDFESSRVKTHFKQVIKRYPNTNIVWCAGGQMALEVLNQLKQHQPVQHKVLIGGFDWLPDAIEKVSQGELSALVGGHFLMGNIALQLIASYENKQIKVKTLHPLKFELITQQNAETYLAFIENRQWRLLDYTAYFTAGASEPYITVKGLINQVISAAH